ncbi:alpha/beta hydrolase [Porticoccaceae bacterium]|nr:alpha/beta hydrolase [Porticoccaceae bacterium]MDA9090923.1 alpha/beta hydrolase [Porticoccaceae bacterium]
MKDKVSSAQDIDMTINCEGFSLPESPLLGAQTRDALRCQAVEAKEAAAGGGPVSDIPPTREESREQFYQSSNYKKLRERYAVDVVGDLINGVYTETITPKAGVSKDNAERVLINFHGGSFQFGSRTNSQLESIPVAALGNIKVVSVDYRMYPEHRFPAATEDALTVYKALLENYSPNNIGIFGTSSGAQLTAQLLYRLIELDEPLPAAVAMIAEGATRLEGDSIGMTAPLFKAQTGMDLADALIEPYFETASQDEPRVNPALDECALEHFPPSFLASSTRDICLSPVIATHRKLLQQGVEAELHIWEGLEHFFHANVDLPETEELHQCMLNFFERHFVDVIPEYSARGSV